MEVVYKGVRILAKTGDIAKEQAYAIVNPANSQGSMGGGVALAIKLAGGEQLEKDAVAAAPIAIGKAVPTAAGLLKARLVIHSPTMTRPVEKTNTQNIDRAVTAALRVAQLHSASSIVFPGMGTGAGKVPKEDAARAMISAIKFWIDQNFEKKIAIKEIRLVAFGEELLKEFENAISTLAPKPV